jgi:hypothetical protein
MPRFETNARAKTVEQRGNLSLRTMERTVRSLLNSNRSSSKLLVCQNDHSSRSAEAICRPCARSKFSGEDDLYRLTSTVCDVRKSRRANLDGPTTFFQIDEENPNLYRRLR